MKKRGLKIDPIWFIAPAITVVWMLVMYYIEEIFPFGDDTLIMYDLLHAGVPIIYRVHDAWHSGSLAELFYGFTATGGGAWNVVLSLLQPRFIFALFWEREYIAQSIDVFLILEFACISLASSYAFSKFFPKLKGQWLVLVSLMYTFCGFNLMYLSNIDWLDIVLCYPLLLLFARNMLGGKSKFPFFIVLTYLLNIYTYTSFFVVLSLVVFGGLYIFIIEEKENRKRSIFNLGVGTGASLLASAYTIFTYARDMLSSARFGEGAYVLDAGTGTKHELGGFIGILNAENEIDIISVLMFLGMSVSIASLVVLWVHFKKYKSSRKYTIFFTVTILLLAFQVVFKSVMLIWHFGSYQKFPFRNGYMVAFFCCCIVAYYFSNFADSEGIKSKHRLIELLSSIPAFFMAIPLIAYGDVFVFSIKEGFNVLNSLVELQTGCFRYPLICWTLTTVAAFLLIKIISFKKLRNVLTIALAVIILGLNSFFVMAQKSNIKHEDLYTKEESVYKNTEGASLLNRVNNPDGVLISNYPIIAGRSAVSGWLHTLPEQHYSAFYDLGFSWNFTLLYDVGGTQFSKALLGITESVSQNELNGELYTKYAETETQMKLYKNNYTLPGVLAFDESVKNLDADNYDNVFEYQNAIYNSLGEKGDLFNRVQYKDVKEKAEKGDFYVKKEEADGSGVGIYEEEKEVITVTYTFDVSEKSVLYLHNVDGDKSISFSELRINGKKFHVYSGDEDSEKEYNTCYPVSNNNGVLELGVFENETVKVSIKYKVDTPTVDATAFYLMELDKLSELNDRLSDNQYFQENEVIKLNLNANEGDVIFVPVVYDEQWECTVNGEKVEPVCIMGNFMGVEAQDGQNDVVMKFVPKQAYISLIVTLVGILSGVAVLAIEKRKKAPAIMHTLAAVAFTVIFAGFMLVIYIVPVCWSTITEIIGLFK
ncbi:MAG: YfhO family protein [Acutalibacteraceae bacterium]